MSTARGALSVVGQAVGAYFGGPIGAAAGGIIGGEIGGLIDGPPEGPRLDDLSAPQIQYGGKIPRFYGGPRWFEIAPLWMTEKRESSETAGGKGGDSGVEQFSYRIDMLCRVCESREGTPCEVIAVTGVEVDGQLVWSALADSGVSILVDQEIWADMTVQLGHEDQAPWSVMEAAEGTANANAYRGYLTVGFQDFLLGPGGAPRRVRIQAITNGTLDSEVGSPTIYDYTGGNQSYVVGDETSITVYAWGSRGGTGPTALGPFPGGGGGYIEAVVPVTPGETLTVMVGGHGSDDGTAVYGGGAAGGQSASRYGGGGGGRSAVRRSGVDLCTAGGGGGGGISAVGGGGGGADGGGLSGGLGGTSSAPGAGGDSDGGTDGGAGSGYSGGTGAHFNVGDPPDSVAGGGGGGWFGGGGGGAIGEASGGGGGGGGSHAEYLVESIAATDDQHANPSNPYYPGTEATGRVVIVPGNGGWTPEPVDLRDILEYEATRCAPLTAANIDFSAADGIPVDCHVAIGSAAEAMQPLLTRFWFDLFSADKLYLVRRGGEVEQTVSYKWTGSGSGESFAGLKRSNDVEVGKSKAITYSNILADGESDTRTGARESISSDVDTLSMNLNMLPSEAQGLADTATADARVAGHTATVRLGARHGLLLQPGSVLDLIDHHGNTYRTLARRVVWDRWVWEVEVRLDDPAVLQAAGIAVDLDQRAITVAPLPEATLYVLDIPLLRLEDDGPGEYVAVTQTGRWRGVDILKSSDNVTYSVVAEMSGRATAGICDSELPAYEGWGWDNSSTLTVTLDDGSGGTLSSATKAAIEADRSLNLAVVYNDSGSEVIQFATATLLTGTTYEISGGILRNLLGTEWANGLHAVGDKFVLINTALANAPGSVADLGQTRYYKARPAGRSTSSVDPVSIVCAEQRLLPYAPVDVRNEDGTVVWNRRSRISGAVGIDPPLGEASERYDAELYDGATLEDSASALTTPEWTPGTDPSGLEVHVYQLSELVGRGHVAEKVLS